MNHLEYIELLSKELGLSRAMRAQILDIDHSSAYRKDKGDIEWRLKEFVTLLKSQGIVLQAHHSNKKLRQIIE